MQIEIKKAQITGRMFLSWEYDEVSGNRKTNLKAKSDAPIHEDLREAIKALTPHFVMLTEMKKKPELAKELDLKTVSESLLKLYNVKGFTIEEVKGITFITLTGTKILSNGKSINFETPRTDRGTDEDAYEFFDKLMELVESCQEEILDYMDGKQAESNQTEMFGEEAGDFNPEETQQEEEEDMKFQTDDAA
jgi:hypothetical protein